MRYQSQEALEKHIESAFPDHYSSCYLLLVPSDYERRALAKTISHKIKKSYRYLSGEKLEANQVLEASYPDLFGEAPFCFVDEVEKMGKKEWTALMESLPLPGLLLLGGRTKVPLSKTFEKEGVILDLTDEKPWDKEKRMLQFVKKRVSQEGKSFMPEALTLFFENQNKSDMALLEREVEKLFAYVGEKKTLETADVEAISLESREETLWQIAEEIVFGEKPYMPKEEIDPFALFALLRSQLEIGAKIASMTESKLPKEEWGQFLPKMWPKALEKKARIAEKLGSCYFLKRLKDLFEVEMLSRSGSGKPLALFSSFCLRSFYGR